MRYIFGKELEKYMALNKKIIVLCPDIGYGVLNDIKEKYAGRVFNTGITEVSTIGIACGLAQEDFIPLIYTITPFLLERPYEILKLMVSMNLNVKLVSYGDYPNLGITHSTKDVPELCKYLNLKLYQPKTKEELLENLNNMFNETIPSFTYLKKI